MHASSGYDRRLSILLGESPSSAAYLTQALGFPIGNLTVDIVTWMSPVWSGISAAHALGDAFVGSPAGNHRLHIDSFCWKTETRRAHVEEAKYWRSPITGSFKRLCTSQHIVTQSHPCCNSIADCTVLSSVLTVTSPRSKGPDTDYGHLTRAPLEPSKLCEHSNSMPQQNYERHFCATRPAHGTGRLRDCRCGFNLSGQAVREMDRQDLVPSAHY